MIKTPMELLVVNVEYLSTDEVIFPRKPLPEGAIVNVPPWFFFFRVSSAWEADIFIYSDRIKIFNTSRELIESYLGTMHWDT